MMYYIALLLIVQGSFAADDLKRRSLWTLDRECSRDVECPFGFFCVSGVDGNSQCVQTVAAVDPVDCIVGAWLEVGDCSASCGGGVLTEARTILTHPTPGGNMCPADLSRTVPCNENACPAQADVYDEWAESNCSGNDNCRIYPGESCENDTPLSECKSRCDSLEGCSTFGYRSDQQRCCVMQPECTTGLCLSYLRSDTAFSIFTKSGVYHELAESNCSGNDNCRIYPGESCENDTPLSECKSRCDFLEGCSTFGYRSDQQRCCIMQPECTAELCQSYLRSDTQFSIFTKSIPTDRRKLKSRNRLLRL